MNHFCGKKILVTGGKGFIGSHLVEALRKNEADKKDIVIPDSQKDNLRVLGNCLRVTKGVDLLFHLAADVGGVAYSKTHPATQLHNCLLIDLNLLKAARKNKVGKVVLVSCSPAYPKNAPMPLLEESVFDGLPADSHLGFGWAKRTMAVLAWAYRQEFGMNVNIVIPANAYGPGDNFDPETSHVIPSLIRKCFKEKELVIWGNGSPKRDFIYVADVVDGLLLAAERLDTLEPVNLGSGEEVSIAELVKTIVKISGFKGKLIFDETKPKGELRRVVSIEKAKNLLGFSPKTTLGEGLKKTILWYKKSHE